jgi:hypothetical protein
VTLATIFQYRLSRQSHRWQFWLDISSSLWLSGGAANLFAAPLFLQGQLGCSWTLEESERSDVERLRRILIDLLSRVNNYGQSLSDNGPFNSHSQIAMSKQHRIYLCHSELAVSGQEQTGPLLPLIYACESAKPSILL